MKTISVNASKNYDVLIDKDILNDAGTKIRDKTGGQKAAIITDDIVESLYGGVLENSLQRAGYSVTKCVLQNGEASKTTHSYLSVIDLLAGEKLSRTDVVIAFGGGVPGDIAGFAAATYMRGVRFVQIPTTLLAAVDSSVGGKTAVNLTEGKNLLGTFYQPDLVICDISLLSTLPDEVYRDGCAEVIKYGVIADKDLFDLLKEPKVTRGRFSCHLEVTREPSPCHPCHLDIVYRCVKIKRDIVTEDEFEFGSRKLLNFGHTVGHAVEKLSDYKISHGQAVAIGMAVETRAAVKMGLCKTECLSDILEVLSLYGLPQTTVFGAKELADACLSDKKRDGGSLTMVFPKKIGKCILKDIPFIDVEAIIKSGLEE